MPWVASPIGGALFVAPQLVDLGGQGVEPGDQLSHQRLGRRLRVLPLNEFSSPGYLSMAFPYLFPYGRCDFSMPRERKVSFKDCIHHLMSYKDQRFAKDERFRYFIMNTQMRWESLNIGNVMRSTKSFWNSRCSELLDMVNQIGAPTVFFTLSSADYHWPDLYRLLGHDVSKLSAKEKGILLADNPLIADSFFYLRYEYQHRGSIHLHGLAWLKGAPHVSENMSEDQKKVALEYFDNLISCSNPDIHVLPLTQHPCQISLENVTDVDTDLAHLLNQVQRHTKCSKNHCLRVTGKEKKLQCRYKFPKSLTSETTFEMKENDIVDINFKRNDVFMNKYNPWLLQTWRANIDFSPVISKRVVYQYIAKSLGDLLYVDDDMRQYSLRLFSKYMKTPNLEDLDDNDEDFSEIKTRASSEGNDVVHVLSSYNPNKTHQSTRSEQLHNLNMRWDYLSSKLTLDTIHIVTELLQSETKTHRPDVMDYSVLNSDQKTVFKHIMSIAEKISKGDQSSFEFLIVQGMAGTGKTYLLKCCAQYVKAKLGDRAFKLLASTGVAAKIINGTTLHSFLSLGRYGFGVTRLTGIELLNYQQKHSGLKFLLVDEYSMVGLKMLALIDQRCRDLTGMEEIFGNLVIVFFGDINQLMPVDDVADGLPNVLEVSLGSKIMLRRNLNVSRGLVNGSIGVVKHIWNEKGKKPPSLPERKVSHKDREKLANEEDKRKMKQRLYKRMYRKKLSVKQKETCKEKDKIYRRLKRMREKLKKKNAELKGSM
ncbi:ATP-dependent DNA helicase [Frankliniella fusca]|uniref:ATP-dependent DNA helicase n=1 Tax=Frankliniella fusca TaxID=407009 RepID=A0AAE1H8N8_9NEOP|nr:ATP-dependent DNA helicase [Frankliniella fusca]